MISVEGDEAVPQSLEDRRTPSEESVRAAPPRVPESVPSGTAGADGAPVPPPQQTDDGSDDEEAPSSSRGIPERRSGRASGKGAATVPGDPSERQYKDRDKASRPPAPALCQPPAPPYPTFRPPACGPSWRPTAGFPLLYADWAPWGAAVARLSPRPNPPPAPPLNGAHTPHRCAVTLRRSGPRSPRGSE